MASNFFFNRAQFSKVVNKATLGLFGYDSAHVSDKVRPNREVNAHNPDRFVMPFQLQRLRQDAESWRDAVSEAENAWYPHRVKMQQIFIDTIMDGHVTAVINKRKDLTLLKDFELVKGETCDEKATELLKADWFLKLVNYILDAPYYGYTLVGLGDLINNEFPDLKIVRRWNVSPDRLNLVSIPYALSGINFTDPSDKDEDGNSFYDWSIWVETPTEAGPSRCGYGLLYKVAIYQIYLRHIAGFNADYCELFGQPYRHLKTDATGKDLDKQKEAMDKMASSGWIVTPKDVEIEFVTEQGSAKGYMSYSDFETRLEKKISKIILGHEDGISSTPGKLGSGNNKEGDIQKALDDVESKDVKLVEHIVNSQVIPKLQKIGFPIPMGLKFRYKNDREMEEVKERENLLFKDTAEFLKTMKDAGFQVSEKWVKERLGIDVEKAEAPEPLQANNPADVREKIKNFYAKTKI